MNSLDSLVRIFIQYCDTVLCCELSRLSGHVEYFLFDSMSHVAETMSLHQNSSIYLLLYVYQSANRIEYMLTLRYVYGACPVYMYIVHVKLLAQHVVSRYAPFQAQFCITLISACLLAGTCLRCVTTQNAFETGHAHAHVLGHKAVDVDIQGHSTDDLVYGRAKPGLHKPPSPLLHTFTSHSAYLS